MKTYIFSKNKILFSIMQNTKQKFHFKQKIKYYF